MIAQPSSRALCTIVSVDVDAIDAAGLAAIEDQLASIDEAEDKAVLTRALGAMNPTAVQT